MKEKAELKTFKKPDEVREFPKGRLELVKIGGVTVGRAAVEPRAPFPSPLRSVPRSKKYLTCVKHSQIA